MKRPRLVLAEAAVSDILEQADWYQSQSGTALVTRWARNLEFVFSRIVRSPLSGARCRFRRPELRNVRRIPVRGFPKHLVFYQILEPEVVILRVIHGARDLETLL